MRNPARSYSFRPAALCTLAILGCLASTHGQDLVRDTTTNENTIPNQLAVRLDTSYQASDSFINTVTSERTFVAPSLLWQPRADTTITFRGEYSHDREASTPGLPYLDGRVLPGVAYDQYLGEPDVTNFNTDTFRGLLTVEHEWADNIVTTASFHPRQADTDGGYFIFFNFAGPQTIYPVTGLVSRGLSLSSYSDEDETVRLDQSFTWTLYQGADAPAAPATASKGTDPAKDAK